jgi:hypothetical protein
MYLYYKYKSNAHTYTYNKNILNRTGYLYNAHLLRLFFVNIFTN